MAAKLSAKAAREKFQSAKPGSREANDAFKAWKEAAKKPEPVEEVVEPVADEAPKARRKK